MLDTRRSSQITSYYYRYGAQIKPDWLLERAKQYAAKPFLCAPDHLTQILSYVIVDDQRRSRFYGKELAEQLEKTFKLRRDRMRSLALESRVLAYRDIAPAAELCGIPVNLGTLYTKVFFDVWRRMDAGGWIKFQVFDDKRRQADHLRRELYRQAYLGASGQNTQPTFRIRKKRVFLSTHTEHLGRDRSPIGVGKVFAISSSGTAFASDRAEFGYAGLLAR